MELLVGAVAAEMEASDYRLGCALQNLAAERAAADPALGRLLEAAVDSWVGAVERYLVDCGVANARDLSVALVAAIEGARNLARVTRSNEAFSAVRAAF